MTETATYRPVLNSHAIAIILKELVWRAIGVIRKERFAFEVSTKPGYGRRMEDVFTNADKEAQRVYLKSITECFPDFGVIAEEDMHRTEPKNGCRMYLTVDGLDGTRAFIRRQSHGVGTMIALVEDGKVISAFVGDINSQEIFGFRMGSQCVHRITELGISENLTEVVGTKGQLGNGYVLLRESLCEYSPLASSFLKKNFKSHQIDGGSIGTWFARLWKGEIDAAILPPGTETPWDASPVVGISLRLGFAFMRPDPSGERWERYEPTVSMNIEQRPHDTLVIHENYVDLLNY